MRKPDRGEDLFRGAGRIGRFLRNGSDTRNVSRNRLARKVLTRDIRALSDTNVDDVLLVHFRLYDIPLTGCKRKERLTGRYRIARLKRTKRVVCFRCDRLDDPRTIKPVPAYDVSPPRTRKGRK